MSMASTKRGPVRRYPNETRFVPGDPAGHYESFYQRANHPTRPLALWIRYTIFSPKGRPQDAAGELWAIFFDGERREHVAVYEEHPLARCELGGRELGARIGPAHIGAGALEGVASARGHEIRWSLRFSGEARPMLLIPEGLYEGRFPKAKSVTCLPFAVYEGALEVDGQRHAIDRWVGSQNHNWGVQHTDDYAYGQIVGFDDHPESFLELATGRLRVGPVWTPFFTPLMLRHRGRDVMLTGLGRALRSRGRFRFFDWTFSARTRELEVEGRIWAPEDAFVALPYRDPPGGVKTCLNSKIASARVTLRDRRGGAPQVLRSEHRAAFEILTDDPSHGIPLRW